MAGTAGSLPAKGAVKQGQLIGKLDFGTGQNGAASIWSLFLCVFNGKPYLFGRHSSAGDNGAIAPFSDTSVGSIGKTDFGVLYNIADLASQPLTTYTTDGVIYTADNTKDIYYTDGAGNFKSTPYADVTTTDTVNNILKTYVSGETTPAVVVEKSWYMKPVTWVIAAAVAIGGFIWYKS